ncbi:cytochrome c-type biogenesis protein CcmH [Erwinia sp. OLTSP20]|uniref:cytochrome c-type biogenesis protein n=1 Tax=unclassified Erwinia TaxID=2622719 RepID=UPI000C1A80F2|nr:MULTISPECIES: cytochrome c-type biogenesis protein [unclassified Erwinia]PIJ51532.1 cytochrome c-type biogenesis protein CcmH [Erwinia sp. OAMSP11]PIJ75882.1 cytochrome c-type biogenesis protein CcmH [Erwinia sp. OLSSP12]PIJ83442.1 cytochrome c-type biogenesis protein CcmH [Erwinia sp. OLCASP19]PIJ86275.1 cytochrome c-type biogenesis protein CcmH [Erwinia sp. OLMTSP26]PIJ88482.1 cytochrome c-type biogenesis protein CcmH [Erwinia sp. OLMDSP33]
MRLLLLLLASLFCVSTLAAIDVRHFSSPQQEQQYRSLTESLRCPKCQNNSIADSNAMIAADMRLKVYQLLQQGLTPQQIRDYMIARYGNFVSYQPPFELSTIILWLGPLLFLLAGGGMIIVRGRRMRRSPVNSTLNAEQQRRLDSLLHDRKQS